MKIGLDPGHGGKDPGAIGPTGLREKDVNLSIVQELTTTLKNAGLDVFVTRNSDWTVDLPGRTKALNNAKCDLAISVHINSATRREANYISTFIQGRGGQAEKLAGKVQDELVRATGWPDGGVRVANYHMTRETVMPAILVECGFISNPEQERQLRSPEMRKTLAGAIADGVLAHLGIEKGGEGMFKDIKNDRWSAKVIKRAADAGIVAGYPDGTFRPEKSITREEMAAVISKLLFRDGIFTDILPEVTPSVVLVHAGPALGSGACISRANGWSYIITNSHVVGNRMEGFCVKDAADIPNFDWELWSNDPAQDLAIVRTKYALPPLSFAEKYELGEPVAAIGAPQGFTETVTVGILSNINRGDVLQIDAPISPGNSGGPCVNERGEIVGIVTAKLVDLAVEGMGFIIKSEIVKKYIDFALS